MPCQINDYTPKKILFTKDFQEKGEAGIQVIAFCKKQKARQNALLRRGGGDAETCTPVLNVSLKLSTYLSFINSRTNYG